jgi:hypothetical protein
MGKAIATAMVTGKESIKSDAMVSQINIVPGTIVPGTMDFRARRAMS